MQAINHTLVAAAAAMANGGDEIAADKHMGLAKFQARFPQLRGARGNEHVAFIFLELGALVGGNRIFQCQRVQSQFITKTRDGLAVGGFQLDPDEAVGLADVIADVVKCKGLDVCVLEEQAVDDGS